MKKLLINFGFLVLVAVIGLTCMGNASAAPGGLSQLISWFKSPPAQEKIVEPASASAHVNPEIKLADMTTIPDNLPTASKPDFPSENLGRPPVPKSLNGTLETLHYPQPWRKFRILTKSAWLNSSTTELQILPN